MTPAERLELEELAMRILIADDMLGWSPDGIVIVEDDGSAAFKMAADDVAGLVARRRDAPGGREWLAAMLAEVAAEVAAQEES